MQCRCPQGASQEHLKATPAMDDVSLDTAEADIGPQDLAQAAPVLGAPHAPAAAPGSLVMKSLDDGDNAAAAPLLSQHVPHPPTGRAASDQAGDSIPFVPQALPIPCDSNPSAVMLQVPHAVEGAEIGHAEAAALPSLPHDESMQASAARAGQPEVVTGGSSTIIDRDASESTAELTTTQHSQVASTAATSGHREGGVQPMPLKMEGGSSAAAAAVAAAISAAAAAAEEAESVAVAGKSRVYSATDLTTL